MVEVFSTDVENHKQADFLLRQLESAFPLYEFNFDLEDCDNILRLKTGSEVIDAVKVIALLQHLGFTAQVLPDTPQCKKEPMLAAPLNN